MPLAYFITFSTYGTWLHGIDKGLGSVDKKHARFGTPYILPDEERLTQSQAAMSQPEYVMSESERIVVRDAIVEISKEKGWLLWAIHVRSNHVHVVVQAERDPNRIMADLKARTSRNLTRSGFGDTSRRRWTRHGSTKYLFDEASVVATVHYTLYEQGEPMAVFDGSKDLRTLS